MDSGHASAPNTTAAAASDQPYPTADQTTPERAQEGRSSGGSTHYGSRPHRDGRSSRGSAGAGSHSKRSRQLWVARFVALAAVLTSLVLAMLLIRAHFRIDANTIDHAALASELNRTKTQLAQTKQQLARQESERTTLLQQRIPGIAPLELDQLYDIKEKYVKRLSFSEAGIGNDKRLTYYVVLKNADEIPVIPAVTILLFDRTGLQTGMAQVKHEAATTATEHEQLEPGETRTYSAAITAIRDATPTYFLVEIR